MGEKVEKRILLPGGKEIRAVVDSDWTPDEVRAKLIQKGIIDAPLPKMTPPVPPMPIPDVPVSPMTERDVPAPGFASGLGTFGVPPRLKEHVRQMNTIPRKAAAETMPLLGATAASLAMPPLGLPMLSRMAAGGLASRAGAFAASNAPKIPAAGAGGALGGAVEGHMKGEDPAAMALARGKEMATDEAVGLGVGKLAQKVLAPGASTIKRRVMEVAKELKLPISSRHVTESGTVSLTQKILENYFPSRWVAQPRLKAISRLIAQHPGRLKEILEEPELVKFAREGIKHNADLAGSVFGGVRSAAKSLPEDKLVQSIATGGEDVLDAAAKLFRPQNIDSLKSLRRLMPKAAWKDTKDAWVASLIKRSMVEDQKAGVRVVDGTKLRDMMEDARPVLEKFYFPGEISRLENLAVYAAVHREVPALANENFITQSSIAVSAGVQFAAGALVPSFIPGTFALMETSAIAMYMANSMMKPGGVLNNWLTTGLAPPGLIEAAKLGARIEGLGETPPDLRPRNLQPPFEDRLRGLPAVP